MLHNHYLRETTSTLMVLKNINIRLLGEILQDLCIFIFIGQVPVWMIVTIIEGHKGTRKLKPFHLFHHKVHI